MYKEIFTARLKHTRTQMGFTQEEMAKNIGVARPTYTLWENGKREPDIETLGKISEILNTDLNWLIGAENNDKLKLKRN